ncbi:MAG: sulfotransferase family protein [Rhodospirillaceae bacterium]|nr:sulfotransferase family protein [Rhodospirillaceae bacterium]
MTDTQRLDGVSMCGTGHSGSTLLGMVLSGLPEAFYMGEGGKVRYLNNDRYPMRKRVCKICGEDCPIWSVFSWDRSRPLYSQIAAHTGARLVIDSTKSTDWIAERTGELFQAGGQSHLIQLLRDGRAVVNSRLRKYPDRDPEAEIQHWMTQVSKSMVFFESFDGPKLRVRYESLATEPDTEIRNICAFLGQPFNDDLLDYHERDHHPLGGNNGTQYAAARHRFRNPDAIFATVGPSRKAFYDSRPPAIALDDRWKDEMTEEHAMLFDRMAGSFNEPMRWGD